MNNPQRADRQYEKDEDQRSPFERDRDAILYASAFRRLAGVTQVFSPVDGHIYHNRLTHTLEVAQIGRRLSEFLLNKLEPDDARRGLIDPSVVEAAALAHDLGHPPFGHIAEKELNRLVFEQGVTDGYEGNAQSFRIITKLAMRYESEPGLNLTRATLNATLKYPFQQTRADDYRQSLHKWGAYRTESNEFAYARAMMQGDELACQSLEAEIMDWADDIAYSIHDTEDFYKAGLIPLGTLATVKDARKQFLHAVFERWKRGGKPVENEGDYADVFDEVCDAMPFSGPYEPTRELRAQVRGFSSQQIGSLITSTTLNQNRQDGHWLAVDKTLKMRVDILKQLTWEYVILGSPLIGVQYGQKKIIRSLFEIFMDAISSNQVDGRWRVFPIRNQSELIKLKQIFGNDIPMDERVRAVSDAIAGMTDQQCVRMYQRLSGTALDSSFDSIVS